MEANASDTPGGCLSNTICGGSQGNSGWGWKERKQAAIMKLVKKRQTNCYSCENLELKRG